MKLQNYKRCSALSPFSCSCYNETTFCRKVNHFLLNHSSDKYLIQWLLIKALLLWDDVQLGSTVSVCISETCCAYDEIHIMGIGTEVSFITRNNWMINGMIKLQELFQVEGKLIKDIHLLDQH